MRSASCSRFVTLDLELLVPLELLSERFVLKPDEYWFDELLPDEEPVLDDWPVWSVIDPAL